jgi:hypothetical protein
MNTKSSSGFAGATSSAARPMAASSKTGREIAILSGLQILIFLALAALEPRFLFVHLYEVVPYTVILLLFAYRQTRWIYLTGPLFSLLWLALAFSAGLLQTALERVRHVHGAPTSTDLVALLALSTAVVAVLMTVLCRLHWIKEFSGRGRALPALLASLAFVAAYYASLLHWFWAMMRKD